MTNANWESVSAELDEVFRDVNVQDASLPDLCKYLPTIVPIVQVALGIISRLPFSWVQKFVDAVNILIQLAQIACGMPIKPEAKS